MRRLFWSLALFSLLVAGPAAAQSSYLESFDIPADAEFVGADMCVECHDVGEFYQHSPHAVERALTIPGTDVFACEACHGPGSLHVEEGGEGFILGPGVLGSLPPSRREAMCTQCHTAIGTHYAGGPHQGTEISCADCHSDQAHFGGAARPAKDFRVQGEFCLQCHAEQVSDFRQPFRHRVLEGEMDCSDCHDPHRGFEQTTWNGLNETCLGCHTEMAGPFVFEHAGVSEEDCTACHRPHGSNNDQLLVQDGNGLCLQCHFDVAFNADDGFAIGDQSHAGLLTGEARCYDCHFEIHGSNVSPTFQNQ